MTTFLAGEKLRASELNSYVPILGRATADTTKNASTTLGDVTGLAVTLEANATYVFDGYVAYSSGATPDIKFGWTVPSGVTGHWSLHGMGTSSSWPGNIDSQHVTSYSSTIPAGGDGTTPTLAVWPLGYLVMDTTAGTVQLRFAQNTSNASDTTVLTGSWLRFQRVS